MKLFISWSGKRSQRVAELLSNWISIVIQRIEPWISTDMDRGTLWFSEVQSALVAVEDGIVCLTRENLSSPWILFEAGALANKMTSCRVYTFLVDLEDNDISPPLSQFNHTKANRDGLYQLCQTLNNRLGAEALSEKILATVFERNWPIFEEEFNKILSDTTPGQQPPPKSEYELLSELSEGIRRIERQLMVIPEPQRTYTPLEIASILGILSKQKQSAGFDIISALGNRKNLQMFLTEQVKDAVKLFEQGKKDEAKRKLEYVKQFADGVGDTGTSSAVGEALEANVWGDADILPKE